MFHAIYITAIAAIPAAAIHVPPDAGAAGLRAAIDEARKLPPGAERRIVLPAGAYFLEAPIVLDARDSGLTIEAAPGSAPLLIGGRRIEGWEPDGDRFFAAEVPDVAAGTWDFRMLVVNDRFARRARFPAEGRLRHLSTFDVPWMSTTGGGWQRKPTDDELRTMRYRPEDLGSWLDIRNAELTVYHMWDESVVGLAANDQATHILRFSNPAGHPPGAFGVKDYVVWNVREGMTRPGQWYLDRRAGKVVYWPLPGEDLAKAEVLAPVVETIVRIQGTEKAPVENVTLRGLSFSVTNVPLVAGGFGAGNFPGAISLVHARECRLEGLTVSNVAGQGIKAWATRGLRIERCTIHDTGACGIRAGGEGMTIADNRISRIGLAYPSAIALWPQGKGGTIEHNDIHDTPYSAIVAGGEDLLIAGNRISRAMQELHDGAGIYITFCKRIVLRGNFIHDIIDTGGYGASAYYLDEQAEGCLVEGNLSIRVARPSHNHMAKKNAIRNNVFVVDGDASLTFPRSSDFTFEKNVIAAKGKIVFDNPAAITTFSGNILFSVAGIVEGRALRDYARTGTEPLAPEGNTLADPKLLEFETGRVRFAPDSPAGKLGIEPIDVSGAGPRPGADSDAR
ncbi:MAG: right-handed parallel beta-helix repeat-containing protein [Planctomycetes bacterium]|nr:right-handed parallel beta-helix repeat-containing protein [Planctomycetota bacterium]